jgi:hypothetical protein
MKNISQEQMAVLRRLCLADKRMRVRWCESHGVASVIEGNLAGPGEIMSQLQTATVMPDKIFQSLLELFGILVGPPDIHNKHRRLGKEIFDRERNSLRMRAGQVSKSLEGFDLPVYDTVLLIQVDSETGFYRIQSSFWRNIDVDRKISVDENGLKELLAQNLARAGERAEQFRKGLFDAVLSEIEKERYPLISSPSLYLYPLEGYFRPVYYALAYQPVRSKDGSGNSRTDIEQVQVILDAATGKRVLQQPTRTGPNQMRQVSITLPGSSGCEPLQGLSVAEDGSGRRWMINEKDEGFRIKMHDAAGKSDYKSCLSFLKGPKQDRQICAVDFSSPAVTGDRREGLRRSAAPEVSAYLKAEEAWSFYQQQFKWRGFDNGEQETGGGASCPCPVQIVVHTGMGVGNEVTGFNYYYDPESRTYCGYVYFGDGVKDDRGNLRLDFDACDPSVFAHEYQHAITYFGTGTKKHIQAPWLYAINEGLSDSFACLRTGKWIFPLFYPEGIIHRGPDFSMRGTGIAARCMPYRRIEFPRSTDTFLSDWYWDHFDDRNIDWPDPNSTVEQQDYYRSTLISHLAYLVGQGGIHQRTGRSPELIPVSGLGLEDAAWIFHCFTTTQFELISGKGARKENDFDWKAFVDAGQNLLKAAQEKGKSTQKCQYVMMRRALYAVGLHPYENYKKIKYGGEACMLPWTWEWRFSRPYLGFPDLPWQSPDLMVSDDGHLACNPRFVKENLLFARVRNIGDAALKNIRVRFYYHPLCTNLPAEKGKRWKPCRTKAGQDCILKITNLPAGSLTFDDIRNASPGRSVHWYLNREDPNDGVSHFSLCAVIEFDGPIPPNHRKNMHPYEVFSSVIFLDRADGKEQSFSFLSIFPPSEDGLHKAESGGPPQSHLEIRSSLPEGYRIETDPAQENNRISLKPGETKVTCRLKMPESGIDRLGAPYEGRVTSSFKAVLKEKEVSGEFIGELCIEPYSDINPSEMAGGMGGGLHITRSDAEQSQSARDRKVKLTRMLSGKIKAMIGGAKVNGSTNGSFDGTLDTRTGELVGKYHCNIQFAEGMFKNEYRKDRADLGLKGLLQPLRAIHFSQYIGDKAVGGVTVIVREPAPAAAEVDQ